MAEEQKKRVMESEAGDEVNVFVKHLPSHVNDVGLRQLFKNFRKILSAKVIVDSHHGSSLGFEYVPLYLSSFFFFFLRRAGGIYCTWGGD
jgi:RNA recognition motif-containing protein